ncbi:thyroid receptor-interacting protein 11-like isoform X2 [Ctenocephalides felis]|nr:thyroid receptor-interacting protein 11-like isoform X2 [Ctenocephalides felis]
MEDSWIWTEGDDETETLSQESEKKRRSDSAELKSRILELEQENQTLTSNLEELDSQHNLASQKLIEIKNELQKKYDGLMQELQVAKSENIKTAKETQRLKDENERLKVDFDKVQEDLSILQDENFDLQRVTQDLKSAASGDNELKKLRDELQILTKKYEELSFTNERLKTGMDKIDEDRAVLQDDNFTLQDQIAELRRQAEEKSAGSEHSVKTELEATKKKIEQLTFENERLKVDCDKVQEDLSNLQDENFQLQEEIEMLKNSSVPCAENSDALKVEIDNMRKDLEILKKKELDLLAHNERLKVDQDKIEEDRCVLQDENFKLQEQVQSLTSTIAECSNYEDMKKENADLKLEVDKLSSLRAELDDLQKSVADLKFENERLRIDQDKIEEDRSILQDANFELQDQIAALKSEASDSGNSEKKYADLKLEFDKLTQADAELHQELERLKVDLDKVEEDRCILQDQNFELQEQISVLRNTKPTDSPSALETLRQENLDLKIKLETKLKEQTDLRLLQAEKSDLLIRNEKLVVDFHTVEAHKKVVEKNNAELQQEIQNLITQQIELKNMIDTLKKNGQENKVLIENNAVLKKQIEALAEVKNDVQQQLESVKANLYMAGEDKGILHSTITELRKQIEESERLKIDHKKLMQDLSVLQVKNQGYEGDIVNLNGKIQQHLSEIDVLKQKISTLTIQGSGDSKNNLKDDYDRLKIDYEKVQEDCSVLQDENFDLQQKLREISDKSNSDGLRSQVQSLMEEKTNIVKDLEKIKQQLAEAQSKNLKLEQQLKVLDKNEKLIKEANVALIAEKQAISLELDHYQKECAELMKNYDKIYLELEEVKSTKLETISEKNEESFLNLEQQLENCSSLNQSLEDQYKNLEQQLDHALKEKKKIEQNLNESLEQAKAKIDKLTLDHEQEKSTLLFELNELKTNVPDKNVLQDLENKCTEYEAALQSAIQGHENLLKENSHLKQELHRMAQNLDGHNTKVQILDSKSGMVKPQVDNGQLNRLQSELQTALETIETLKAQNTELHQKYSTELQNYKAVEITLRHQIDELRQKDGNKNVLDNVDSANANRELQKGYLDLQNRLKNIVQENENLKALQQQIADLQAAYAALTVEKNNLQELLKSSPQNASELQTNFIDLKTRFDNIIQDNEKLKLETSNLQKTSTTLMHEKQELIEVLKRKHKESVTYHAEIQRLSGLLQAELAKNQNQEQVDPANIEKLTDQIGFLREKCDILTNSLVTEQTNVKLLNQEKKDVEEKAASALKELERLRQHLVEIENSHTQEIMELDMRNNELQTKISNIEEHAIYNNTAYTSASIRANQQAETLQTQLNLMSQQRDELLAKMSDTEDKYNRQVAALTNLQCALEQFQRDKDQEIHQCTERIRNQLELERQEQTALRNEIQSLKTQLSEQQQGLMAAGRLASQLESSQTTVQNLRQELKESQDKYAALTAKVESSKNNQADKIEKSLVKNLMLGYITAGQQNDKAQILKIISAVLDFNQSECDRIGLLSNQKSSWFGGSVLRLGEEGLAKAFVEFLEKESLPRPTSGGPSLLQMQQERKQSVTKQEGSPRDSVTNVSPVPSSSGQTTAAGNALLSQATHENMLPTFAPPRSASSILKDVLKDTNT